MQIPLLELHQALRIQYLRMPFSFSYNFLFSFHKKEKFSRFIVQDKGYSDYFVDLREDLQNEIIRRTGHTGFYKSVYTDKKLTQKGSLICSTQKLTFSAEQN